MKTVQFHCFLSLESKFLEMALWELTKYFFKDWADFNEENGVKSFCLNGNPFGQWYSPIKQTYYFDRMASKGQRYRLNSPLAVKMLQWIKEDVLHGTIYPENYYREGEVTFDLSNHLPKITMLEKFKNAAGYLRFYVLKIEGLDSEEILIFAGYSDSGQALTIEQMERMFELSAVSENENVVIPGNEYKTQLIPSAAVQRLDELYVEEKSKCLSAIEFRNAGFFDTEIEKLDKWSKDVKNTLEKELRTLDTDISSAKKRFTKSVKLTEKVELQEQINSLESRRKELRNCP